jgi:hypothetical protein
VVEKLDSESCLCLSCSSKSENVGDMFCMVKHLYEVASINLSKCHDIKFEDGVRDVGSIL